MTLWSPGQKLDYLITFMIISGGIQWVNSSYNLERISNSLQNKNKQ